MVLLISNKLFLGWVCSSLFGVIKCKFDCVVCILLCWWWVCGNVCWVCINSGFMVVKVGVVIIICIECDDISFVVVNFSVLVFLCLWLVVSIKGCLWCLVMILMMLLIVNFCLV